MIATIAVIADKNGSAIASIDGFHMIAAIAELRPRGPGSNNIVRAIPQIQHSGCELSTPTWGVFSSKYGRRERQRTHVRDLNRISLWLLSSSWCSCTCLYIPLKFDVKTVVFLYFFHKKCHVDCFLNVCVGSHFEKRKRTQCILVFLIWGRWDALWSLESGFHMITMIATITEIELKSISAIFVATIAVIAAIAGEWFPYDRCDRWTFVSSIAAIVAIMRKQGLNVLKKLWKFVLKISKYIFKRNCSIATMNWDHTAKKKRKDKSTEIVRHTHMLNSNVTKLNRCQLKHGLGVWARLDFRRSVISRTAAGTRASCRA